MFKYVVRRLIQAIPTLFGITVFSYVLMVAAPGGPTTALSLDPNIPPEQRAILANRLGVNDPLPVQYIRWLIGDWWMQVDTNGDGVRDEYGSKRGILLGDFGNSFFSGRRPVLQVLGERIPATLELGISALGIGLLLGLPIGILAAVWRGSKFDNSTRVMAVVFNAVPVFWLGLMLILLFGRVLPEALFNAGWIANSKPLLPMGGRCPLVLVGGCPPVYARLNHFILPTFVLSTGGIAGFSRFMRTSMLDVIGQDYVRTAYAKGLTSRMVWFKHGARNALIPIATFLGPAITGLLSGAAITETVFSWPGMGRLAVDSVFQQDYPVIMAVVILSAVATILGFLLSDILYAVIDPRIRFS